MSRSIHIIGSLVFTFIGLASLAIAQELPPASSIPVNTYEVNTGDLLVGVPYISGFECLVFGVNLVREPACDYYKAAVSSSQTSGEISEEICFKEIADVSEPRDYKADQIYRVIVERQPRQNNRGLEGITLARIVSNDPYPYPDDPHPYPDELTPHKWHETTTIALYECEVPYDGKSYN